jgi:hypothetical protein
MPGAGSIRAGRAYVELGVDDQTGRGLKQSEARLKQYAQNVAGLQRKVAQAASASTGAVSGATTLRQAMEGRASAAARASQLSSVLRGQQERAATLAQEVSGRRALAGRLDHFRSNRAQQQAEQAAARARQLEVFSGVRAEAERAYAARTAAAVRGSRHFGGAAGRGGSAARALEEEEAGSGSGVSPWFPFLAGRKVGKFGKLMGSAGTPLLAAAIGMPTG